MLKFRNSIPGLKYFNLMRYLLSPVKLHVYFMILSKELGSTKSSVHITFLCFLLLFIVIISTKDKLLLVVDVLCVVYDKRHSTLASYLYVGLQKRTHHV